MKTPTRALCIVLMIILSAGVVGCLSQEVPLSDEMKAQILGYAEPIADNLFQGFNADNYTMYSRDFSRELKDALNEAAFEQNRALIVSRIGVYLSRSSPVIVAEGEFVSVLYKADFEQEQGVDVRIVFRRNDTSHQIYGLWFNSPKLRA